MRSHPQPLWGTSARRCGALQLPALRPACTPGPCPRWGCLGPGQVLRMKCPLCVRTELRAGFWVRRHPAPQWWKRQPGAGEPRKGHTAHRGCHSQICVSDAEKTYRSSANGRQGHFLHPGRDRVQGLPENRPGTCQVLWRDGELEQGPGAGTALMALTPPGRREGGPTSRLPLRPQEVKDWGGGGA